MKYFSKIITSLENSKTSLLGLMLTFLFSITIRNFLEQFSDSTIMQPFIFMHYTLYFISVAMGLILQLYFFTHIEIKKITKVVLACSLIIVLAPILDLIISKGAGFNISYLIPGIHHNLIYRYFTLGGDCELGGATPGIKIEVVLILIASFIYLYNKNIKILKNIFYTIIIYSTIYMYLILPFILGLIFKGYKNETIFKDEIISKIYLIFCLIQLIIIFYICNKNYFSAILKDLRPFRILHYEFMFLFGIIIGLKKLNLSIQIDNILNFILIPVSIVLAGLFAIVINNFEDLEIDKISNPKRPIILKTIDPEIYLKIGWFSLILALIVSATANFTAFFIILLVTGNYYLYSAGPFRFKRLLLLSKLFISANSLAFVLLGYLIMGGTIETFPKPLFLFFLIGFTAVINFIDIKDCEGDKAENIKTLPTILGLNASKKLIGIFFIITYLCLYLVIRETAVLVISIIFGIFQFFLINDKEYDERYVFALYLLSLITLFSFIYLSPKIYL